jgi:hypothetical protein
MILHSSEKLLPDMERVAGRDTLDVRDKLQSRCQTVRQILRIPLIEELGMPWVVSTIRVRADKPAIHTTFFDAVTNRINAVLPSCLAWPDSAGITWRGMHLCRRSSGCP